MADMLIAVISTLISSIALVGVAVGLLLQARQLRASRIQAARESQVALIRFAIDNPTMPRELEGVEDTANYAKNLIRNWYFIHLSMSYDTRTISKASLRRLASTAFTAEDSRKWWAENGYSYDEMATSKREKEFFAIIEGEFQRIRQVLESAKASGASNLPAESSPPSS